MNPSPDQPGKFPLGGANYENLRHLSQKISGSELPSSDWLKLVAGQVAHLRFGSVQLVVENSKVVQIEFAEKIRLNKPPGTNR